MITSWLKKNWFMLGILLSLAFGFAFPRFGAGLNPQSITSTTIVIVLFFSLGFTLPSESLKTGLANPKMHVLIQVFIFILIPVWFYLTSLPLRGIVQTSVLTGILALACLPTTVSSCTVLTQLAGGNAVATMFNASLANVIGIFLSPVLISLLLQRTSGALPTEEAFRILQGILFKMFVPIVVGQLARIPFKEIADRNKKRFSILSNVLILIIVFLSFSKTVNRPGFTETISTMGLPIIYLGASHLALLGLAAAAARLLRLRREDRISVVFAAPQKTLAMGVPLLTTYFAGREELLGIAVIPLLFYHPFQLLVAGVLKNIITARAVKPTEGADA